MNRHFSRNAKLISIHGDCVSCTTFDSETFRILGGSADYSTPELLIDDTFQLSVVIGEHRPKCPNGWLNRLLWFLAPVWHVELDFDGPPRHGTLEECRRLIYSAMELNPEHYESSWSMEEWKDLIWSAETFEELYLLKQGGESYLQFEQLRAARKANKGEGGNKGETKGPEANKGDRSI